MKLGIALGGWLLSLKEKSPPAGLTNFGSHAKLRIKAALTGLFIGFMLLYDTRTALLNTLNC